MSISVDNLPKEPFDYAAAFFGNDCVINQYITIHQPTIGEIVDFGEKEYWNLINMITIIPSDMKSELADNGLYWGDVPNLDMFKSVMIGMPVEKTSILFGNLDFRKFGWYEQADNGERCMFCKETGQKIDVLIYSKIFMYVSTIHGIVKKPEYAGNEMTRRILIEEDKQKKSANAAREYKSTLMPLASFLANSEGSKCGVNDMRNMKIFPFFDSVKRICTINSANMLLSGIYSGRVNADAVQKKYLDGLRDMY